MKSLKIALVSDELTREALRRECRIMNVTPWNYHAVFRFWRPDVLFVESTWRGWRDSWRYRIASYEDHPERNNHLLSRVVTVARDYYIPAIFWNREDGVHFNRFIESARLFDRVLTVDETMIPRYRQMLGQNAKLDVMMFAISQGIHFPKQEQQIRRAAFVGSYSRHIHSERRVWQDAVFSAANEIGLTIFDRNSGRRSTDYRYPELPWIELKKAIRNTKTADVYRKYAVNLNVNTITDSPSAFSRRLVEILGSGGYVLTNPSLAVERHFADYSTVINDSEQARTIFSRIARDGLSRNEHERSRAGAEYVQTHHTWCHRLDQIMEMTR